MFDRGLFNVEPLVGATQPFVSEAKDTYRTLTGTSTSLYKVKGSKHFGYAFPVKTQDDIRAALEFVRTEHHAARHVCYAWRLGPEGKEFRANDDGEPSNSAGKPILGQLQSFEITQCLVAVVRYFGGVKLGVGGLIDAYRTAAREAIEDGVIVERYVKNHYRIHFPYESMSLVMRVMKDGKHPQSNPQFDMKCTLETAVRLSQCEAFEAHFKDAENVKVEVLFTA